MSARVRRSEPLGRTWEQVTRFLRIHRGGVRLFSFAFLALYVELALIRYLAANVLYLGYFANFVLIAAFLGIGLGFLLARRSINLFRVAPGALLLLLGYVLLARVDVTRLREDVGQLFFGFGERDPVLPLWLSLVLIFGLTVLLFAGIAQETGRLFPLYRPLTAYSIDIAGSMTGIAAFTGLAVIGSSPEQWFLLAAVIMVVLSASKDRLNAALMSAGVVLLIVVGVPEADYSEWSPYQRVDVYPEGDGYRLEANGISHQSMQPVGAKEPIYDYPYLDVLAARQGGGYRNVLVIGAGAGTDTSYALHYGAGHIDAVEIDPEILAAGRRLHPAKPYADPRVDAYVADGRAFMERADSTYDLIVYALPDSLASLSNLSNIRLESFLFTIESFEQAAGLLNDDGVLVLYNYYRREWLVEKLADMLQTVFEHPPMIRTYSDESGGLLSALAIGPELEGPSRVTTGLPLATDDWPFLYMEDRELPPLYVWIMLMFVGTGLFAVALSGQAKPRHAVRMGPFLLMGAAFLLLETKSIIQFSLLFGATWMVNSLVFFAILASVLLANLIVARVQIRTPRWPFALLLASLVATIVLPLDSLLSIANVGVRYVVSSAVIFSPIFCANLVFGWLFKGTVQSDTAFGWNLIGTMIGGAFEYTSLTLGYRALAVVVAGLYLATAVWAMALRPRAPAGTLKT